MIPASIALTDGRPLDVVFIFFWFAGSKDLIKNLPKKPLSGEYFSQAVGLTPFFSSCSNKGK
jgi:hypothetical protein